MYDNEDEIKRKRRKLFIIIAVIVILIIILLIFLFTRGNGKKTVNENTELKCELEVKSGTLGEDGIYTSAVEVGFKSITAISKDIEITKNTVGISDNSRNKETYTISKQGTVTVYGYVQDAAGNKGTCSLEVKVNPAKPTCELEIKSGTLGNNGWYTSDVEIGFKTMESNSTTTKIEKYYLEKEIVSLDSDKVIRAEIPEENMDALTLKDNQTTVVRGYVIDENGNEGTCEITVKKDSEKPTCKLKVVSGTANSSGQYTTTAVVGLESATDNTSDIAEKGVGVSKNYKETTYAVTATGTTKVYGYVKDNAGNEGTCTISITRPKPTTPTNPESYPSCTINVSSGTLSNGTYTSNVTLSLSYSSTNNATITKYGIGTTQEFNSKNSYTISSNGTVKVIGYVQDSNGKTATCTKTITVKKTEYALLSSQVAVGDYVLYDAGSWDSTVKIPTESGKFGGYTAGTNKRTGVVCGLSGETAKSGWQVMSVSNGKVTLIHSGTPECFYYNKSTNATTAVSTIEARASVYKNATYAESARIFTYQEAKAMTESSLVTGTYYYLAGEAKSTDTLWAVRSAYYQGKTITGRSNYAQGIRPVVVLKSTVRTTGKGDNGWVLTNSTYKDTEFELGSSITFDRIVEIINSTKETITNNVK